MRWALLVAAAAAAPDLSKCAKTPPPAVEGCAAEWAALRKSRPAPARRIVVSFLFRDMAPARLVQFVEYYLALVPQQCLSALVSMWGTTYYQGNYRNGNYR